MSAPVDPDAPPSSSLLSRFTSLFSRRGRGVSSIAPAGGPKQQLEGGELIDIPTLLGLLREGATRFKVTYHRRVTTLGPDGTPRTGSTFAFGAEQLEAFLSAQLLRPEAARMLSARVFRDPRAAAQHARRSATLAQLLTPDQLARWTHLSPLVRGMQASGPLGTLHIVLTSRTDGSLLDLLRSTGRLTPVQALAMLRTVTGVLARLHARGYVHGSVAMHNVLYASGGYGGVHFVLAEFSRLSKRSGAGARVQELLSELDSGDAHQLRAERPALFAATAQQLAGPPAQLDLVPLGLMLLRVLRAGGAPGAAADPVRAFARLCLDSDAGFEHAKYKLQPFLKTWRAELGVTPDDAGVSAQEQDPASSRLVERGREDASADRRTAQSMRRHYVAQTTS